MAPYTPHVTTETHWQPSQHHQASVVKLIRGLPRYGYATNINSVLSDGFKIDDYVKGIVISCCFLLIILLLWCLALVFLKFYSDCWASGFIRRPVIPLRKLQSIQRQHFNNEELDNDTSSTSASSLSHGSDYSKLSIDSSIFLINFMDQEELTMAVIAREQKKDDFLSHSQQQYPLNYSTTTNGQLTLTTMLDPHCDERNGEQHPEFCIYIPLSLRLPLLRTYHDCLVHPNNVSNAHTMIYEFFTWKDIRRDVLKYVKCYRLNMIRREGDTLVMHRDEDDADNILDDDMPITLDVIAREQSEDRELLHMMVRAPSVFSTATNGSIQLVTARGKDKKYRIVIPTSLQAKVLKTYHDCLVNPSQENNFDKVLYVHFTWNGIHKDVETYVLNEGLTEEMGARSFRRIEFGDGCGKLLSATKNGCHLNSSVEENKNGLDRSFRHVEKNEFNTGRPIGLDEIAREQKKDKELRQLKKEEPFVFSTVRYGNTLLTTAQNFRDNKYRIVIPRLLQGRMLKTYGECLLNPTPDRNFDSLLYNHFTWNGIHDDVDYFVKNGGNLPKEYDNEGNDECWALIPLLKNMKVAKDDARSHRQEAEHLKWVRENEQFELKIKMIRIVFLLSGFIAIISSIMLFDQGVDQVFNSLNEAQLGLQHTEALARSVLSMTRYHPEILIDIQDAAEAFGTCNISQWCEFMYEASTSEFVLQVQSSTHEILGQLRDTAFRVDVEMKGVEHDIEQLINIVQNVDATLVDFKSYIDVAKILVLFIDIIVACLMTACLSAWMGRQWFVPQFVRKTVIIPLLVTLLILSWIFSTAVLLGAMACADFCSLPEESALSLIVGYQGQLSPFVYMLIMHYVTGCLPERWPLNLENLSSAVSSVGAVLHSQHNAVVEAAQHSGLEEQCGGEADSAKLATLLELTDTAVHGMYDFLMGVRDILECNNFNPIYTSLVNDAMCNSGVTGLSWFFFTSLSVAIFSMVMVTLRVAMHQY